MLECSQLLILLDSLVNKGADFIKVAILETGVTNGSDDGDVVAELTHLLDDVLGDFLRLRYLRDRCVKSVD